MNRYLSVNCRIIIFLFAVGVVRGQERQDWTVHLGEQHRSDQAIAAALEDLTAAGLSIQILDDQSTLSPNSIVVGDPSRNKLSARLAQATGLEAGELDDVQGYAISTLNLNGDRVILVAGGSILGDVYGLYWIWDRYRIQGKIPDMNVTRVPDLKIRFTGGGNREAIRDALRFGANWVWGGPSTNDLVPWDAEPERTRNARNRAELQELVSFAHALHLKFLVYEDEISFHPSLLEEFQATLNPEDPALWSAFQAKYRRLLKALPEVDGVRIRTGEATRVGGNYRAFNVMHDTRQSDLSLPKRYRTFVQKLYEVVVGEFDKIYYQRTWVTNDHEQHSIPRVFSEIFTEEVPVKHLYLSPYLSRTDRFFHQPYNPTFNQTPHNMIVLLAPLDYHAQGGVGVVPSFPGAYFQEGLKTILLSGDSNVKGADFGIPRDHGWDTRDLTAYTVYRLAWQHDDDIRQIAEDFAAINFGQPSSRNLAEILLLSPNAYKYGLYIEPVSYGSFSSLAHMRLTTFPARGFPRLDHGKQHLEFLQRIFRRCRPWIEETLLYLDHGLEVARKMKDLSTQAQPHFADPASAKKVLDSTNLSYLLIKTNNAYVKTFFRYFLYREDPTAENKRELETTSATLKQSMREFLTAPGCVYRLDGIVHLLRNVDLALECLEKAEQVLSQAPDGDEVEALLSELQERYKKVLHDNEDSAVKLLYWEGRVDGKDLLHIQGNKLQVEHLRYDPIAEMRYDFSGVLPAKGVTVIPRDIESRSFRPFILEQPTKANGYQATVYLSDYPQTGYSWWRFELYYIPKSPQELGLEVPWQDIGETHD